MLSAELLAKLLSPRVLLGIFVTILIAAVFFIGYRIISNYDAVEKQNISLQQNVTALQSAMIQQKQSAIVQQQIDKSTLLAVQGHDATQLLESSQILGDQQSLMALGTPTNADDLCSSSPYISTILSRLRNRATNSNNGNSHPTGNATTTN